MQISQYQISILSRNYPNRTTLLPIDQQFSWWK